MKILFFTNLPINVASSWVRVGQYLPWLNSHGVNFQCYSYLPNNIPTGYNQITSNLAGLFLKLKKFICLINILFRCKSFNLIYVQKVVPPIWFQKILKVRNPKILFDFDDAIFTMPTDVDGPLPLQPGHLKKLEYLLSSCSAIVAGNQYLGNYARQFNKNVFIVPSAVNIDLFSPSCEKKANSQIVIGWAGAGEQHLPHVCLLKPALDELSKRYPITLRLIGVLGSERFKQVFHDSGYLVEYIDWVQFDDLPSQIGKFDIGVMPLLDNEWTRGKCGYKALLYMSNRVPCICSPVGINRDIIEDGVNGFWAESTQEWVAKMEKLIQDREMREEFAGKGRETVRQMYSLEVCSLQLFEIFSIEAE